MEKNYLMRIFLVLVLTTATNLLVQGQSSNIPSKYNEKISSSFSKVSFEEKFSQISDLITRYNYLNSKVNKSEKETFELFKLEGYIKEELYNTIFLMTDIKQSNDLYDLCLIFNPNKAEQLKNKSKKIFEHFYTNINNKR
jgi:hypothetical protein